MSTIAGHILPVYPVDIDIDAVFERNRLTTAFRPILALPHILFVGGPIAATAIWAGNPHSRIPWVTGGVLGAVAGTAALVAWFSLIFTGKYPRGLAALATFYLRWRLRAVAYAMLLTDTYPPFGDGGYPARLELDKPEEPRNRVSIAFRIILALPHILAVWALGICWLCTTMVAWFAVLFTGRCPESLWYFGTGALRWSIRLEAYVLLLTDAYPPFSLE
jgi:hypothetical protein